MVWGRGSLGLCHALRILMYVLFVLGVVEITELRVYVVFRKHNLHV